MFGKRDTKVIEAEKAAAVKKAVEDSLREAYDDLPDCSCGWNGKGSGPGGRFMRGDRCPSCGESLS